MAKSETSDDRILKLQKAEQDLRDGLSLAGFSSSAISLDDVSARFVKRIDSILSELSLIEGAIDERKQLRNIRDVLARSDTNVVSQAHLSTSKELAKLIIKSPRLRLASAIANANVTSGILKSKIQALKCAAQVRILSEDEKDHQSTLEHELSASESAIRSLRHSLVQGAEIH